MPSPLAISSSPPLTTSPLRRSSPPPLTYSNIRRHDDLMDVQPPPLPPPRCYDDHLMDVQYVEDDTMIPTVCVFLKKKKKSKIFKCKKKNPKYI